MSAVTMLRGSNRPPFGSIPGDAALSSLSSSSIWKISRSSARSSKLISPLGPNADRGPSEFSSDVLAGSCASVDIGAKQRISIRISRP